MTCSYLNDNDRSFVSFIGVYSTQDHPFALVFKFMEHLNLRGYLRDNQDIGRLDLVRFNCHIDHFAVSYIWAPVIGNSPRFKVSSRRRHCPWKSQDCTFDPCTVTLIVGSHPSRLTSLWAAMDVFALQV